MRELLLKISPSTIDRLLRRQRFPSSPPSALEVATAWTELQPVWGMGQQRVGCARHHIRQGLPFPMRSLHTGNGSEFINHLLQSWCWREGIRFTRGRGYHKRREERWATLLMRQRLPVR